MEVPVEKNKEYIVDIIDNGFEGEGIAKIEGFTVFVPNAIKGERIKILIVKVLSSHAFGKIVEIIKKSEHRIDEDCSTYKRCGGCNLRHIDYKETLKMKQNAVQNLVNKTLKTPVEVKQTIGMKNPYYYRNKLQYPIGIDKNGDPIVGVYANRTHEIIPIDNCMIQSKEATEIAKYVSKLIKKYNLTVYNEITQNGLFRHVVIKTGFKTGEIMVVLVINSKELPYEKEISQDLAAKFSEEFSFLTRLGGDEFCFLIKDVPSIEYTQSIEPRINKIFEDVCKANNFNFVTTITCGIAFTSDVGKDFEALYAKADQALYGIKKVKKIN